MRRKKRNEGEGETAIPKIQSMGLRVGVRQSSLHLTRIFKLSYRRREDAVGGVTKRQPGSLGSAQPSFMTNTGALIWEKAVFYHFIHTVVMFVLANRQPLQWCQWFCFLFGIVLFSGSLYVLALTNVRWLGAITPFGGIAFLAGWLWLALAPGQHPESRTN